MASAIDVRDLCKSYGDNHAVRGISFSVETGEVLALLGPNGAGKTTTVEILEGFRTRDAGTVSVLGHDPGESHGALRQRLGIVLQSCGIDPYLTVREVIEMHRDYYERQRDVAEVIELVGLAEKRDARVKTLSGGQQRRLDVALGLVGDPDLLFLDEPTTGFDPGARRQAWDIVRNLRALGKTVLLTTHYMDEAQSLADRVIVIAKGQIVAEGSPESIGGRDSAQTVVRFSIPDGARPPRGTLEGGMYIFTTADVTRDLYELTQWATEHNVRLESLSVAPPSLEDIYLGLVGEGA